MKFCTQCSRPRLAFVLLASLALPAAEFATAQPPAGSTAPLARVAPATPDPPHADAATPSSRPADLDAARRGYDFLTSKPYLLPDFDHDDLLHVWEAWPEPQRSEAEKTTEAELLRMIFKRYGLTPRPGDDSGKPLQYVVDREGNYTLNCFGCHGGQVAGRVVPGLPNNSFALQSLTEDMRRVKALRGKELARMDYGSMLMPLGGNHGTTNAVMFGVILMAKRDLQLNVQQSQPLPKMVHHDMDAPPWWHFAKRKTLYIDGFIERGHRTLMPFLLIPQNGPEDFQAWESDYRDVYQYLMSLEAPKYPFEVDAGLAEQGRVVFNRNCAECHGTYGEGSETYPNRRIPLDEIGTDPVRLEALSVEHRRSLGESWFGHFGEVALDVEPDGYVAPPLDGVWASAPYLHNGSVPTLWHLLHPEQRPRVWRRQDLTNESYDKQRVGLVVDEPQAIPPGLSPWDRRLYFDSEQFGKSAAGHDFPAALSEPQKRAVLEYLKTL